MRASLLARAMASTLRWANHLEAWWIQGQRARKREKIALLGCLDGNEVHSRSLHRLGEGQPTPGGTQSTSITSRSEMHSSWTAYSRRAWCYLVRRTCRQSSRLAEFQCDLRHHKQSMGR